MKAIQAREVETYPIAVIGNKNVWDIVTETGGRLDRFEGTRREALNRAAELHAKRMRLLRAFYP